MTVEPLSPEAWSDRVRRTMTAVQQQGRTPGRLYATLANSPAMLEAWVEFASRLRHDPTLSRELRELAIVRVAVLTESPYELKHHMVMAAEAGVPRRKLDEVASWSDSLEFTDVERAVLQFCDALVTHGDPAVAGQNLAQHLDSSERVELLLTVTFYCMVAQVLKAMDID
jgi:4-carboxymuconolactone decarboxylase